MTMSFSDLWQSIQQCQLCRGQLPLEPKPVLQADPAARILIAAQAPGRLAHESGRPFDDPSGDRLRRWLGVDRESFYNPRHFALVPMGFCFPGTGKGGDLPPRPECAPAWREPLMAELTHIRLTLVIGQYAQRYHLGGGRTSVTERVSRWRELWPHTVALPHPSGRNNRWLAQHPWFEREVIPALRSRVRELLADPPQ